MADRQHVMFHGLCASGAGVFLFYGCWAGLCITELLAGNTLHCKEGVDFAHLFTGSMFLKGILLHFLT